MRLDIQLLLRVEVLDDLALRELIVEVFVQLLQVSSHPGGTRRPIDDFAKRIRAGTDFLVGDASKLAL